MRVCFGEEINNSYKSLFVLLFMTKFSLFLTFLVTGKVRAE